MAPTLVQIHGQGLPAWVNHLWRVAPRLPVAGDAGQFGAVFEITGAPWHPGPVDYKVALYSVARSGMRGDHVYGFNSCAEWLDGHPLSHVFGNESNLNNLHRNMARGEWPMLAGHVIYSGGRFFSRCGYWVDSALPEGRVFNAIELPRSGYVDAGLRVGFPRGPGPWHDIAGTVVMRQGDGDGISDGSVVQRALRQGTLYRAIDEEGANLAIVWWEGTIWSAANISATQDVYARGKKLATDERVDAVERRVARLEGRR